MLRFLPTMSTELASILGSALVPLGVLVGLWQLGIANDAISKGEVKATHLPPRIAGMPSTEATWKSVRQRARAGDISAIWARRTGWAFMLGVAALIAFPKA